MKLIGASLAVVLMASTAHAQEVTRDDKVISVLSLQRPCKLWLNEARLKELRTKMVADQRGGSMEANMFAAIHDEAVAATFTIVGDHLAKSFNNPEADEKTCAKATGYAKELKLL